MKIGPYRITELSSLADLKLACKFMRVSPHGPKKLLWERLKQEVMKSKLSIAVAVSDDIKKEFERDPIPQALPPLPSQEEIDKHELTRLPRADWFEACQSARSKEDQFSKTASEERRIPVFSIDYMFTGTKDDETGEKEPLSVHLVGQTKY